VKAGERDEFLRAAWRFLVSGRLDARDLVFVDECGSHTSLFRIHGYSLRGERLVVEVPRNRGPDTTLLASMSVEGMGDCLAVEGATTKAVFEAYVEGLLVPSLRAGRVIVMDNLAAHKGERVRELIESRGCEFSTSRPTRRTSIPSRRRSPRSRLYCGGPRPARVRP